ncbi:MAG: N-acetyltransferase family protein [Halobacteriaceae archaeon]
MDDVDDVVDLWVALVADQRAHGAHLLAEPNRTDARRFVAQSVAAGNTFVATVGGRVVGFVSVHVESGVYDQDAVRGVVDNVFVRPASRNRGVGSALLDEAERHLREEGADVLALSALADNEAARRFYRERGYEPHRVVMERGESDTHSKED